MVSSIVIFKIFKDLTQFADGLPAPMEECFTPYTYQQVSQLFMYPEIVANGKNTRLV